MARRYAAKPRPRQASGSAPPVAIGIGLAAVGRFTDEWGRGWPRLQILTLADLFQGKRPAIPFADPLIALRRARREEKAPSQSTLL